MSDFTLCAIFVGGNKPDLTVTVKGGFPQAYSKAIELAHIEGVSVVSIDCPPYHKVFTAEYLTKTED